MIDLGIPSTTVGGHTCGVAITTIHTGFQQATLSLGYVGSAQRDESAKSTVTFAGFQKVSSTGSFRAQTKLFLNVSYDDKWKATPVSSNVTQLYEGILTQNILTRRTPSAACSSDDSPLALQMTGHAYHNNSQGIRVDHSYGFGVSKTFVFGHSTDQIKPGCARAADPYSQRVLLGADVRSVNYILYPPGSTLHGVGTQLQIGYSRAFPSKQVIGLTAAGIPVYNRATMSQAAGIFEYDVPIKSSWAVQFSVSDNYYEIAPKTFNKNYVNTGLGLSSVPRKRPHQSEERTMTTTKKTVTAKAKKTSPKIEKIELHQWLSALKNNHKTALADAATPSGCCQVQNQQTGGVFQIPTDAATCQSIGGVFIPGPC